MSSPRSTPQEITAGPDGALWFTEFGNDALGRIDPIDRRLTEYRVPTHLACPNGITTGSDGALWFTEFAANGIGRYHPRR